MNAIFIRVYPSGLLWGLDLSTGAIERKARDGWEAVTDPAEKALYLKQLEVLVGQLSSPKNGV